MRLSIVILITAVMLVCSGAVAGNMSACNLSNLIVSCGSSGHLAKDGSMVAVGSAGDMHFFPGSRKMVFNGVLVWLNCGLTGSTPDDFELAGVDAEHVVRPLLAPAQCLSNWTRGVVVLDPGHGGTSEGGIGIAGSGEKNLTLDIAKRVWAKLDAAGVDARITRTKDTDLDLNSRCEKAMVWKAAAFISIHLNTGSDEQSSGCETFAITSADCSNTNGGDPESRVYPGNAHEKAGTVLGYLVQRGVVAKAAAIDRGLKRARYQVLRDVDCPSALVECGFLSNRAEEKQFNDPVHRDAVADGIASGIIEWLGLLEGPQ